MKLLHRNCPLNSYICKVLQCKPPLWMSIDDVNYLPANRRSEVEVKLFVTASRHAGWIVFIFLKFNFSFSLMSAISWSASNLLRLNSFGTITLLTVNKRLTSFSRILICPIESRSFGFGTHEPAVRMKYSFRIVPAHTTGRELPLEPNE